MALLALVIARVSCSFQFQSVSLLVTFLADSLGLAPTEFGLLLGIYMVPGLFTAVATPWMTKRFGWQNTLQIALALMALGQLVLVYAASFWVACAGRLVAGVGGCIIYIATVDLAARLTGAGGLPLRMGVIAASWPAGNALALVILGMTAVSGAYLLTGLLPIGLIVLASIMIAVAFRLMASSPSALTRFDEVRSIDVARWRRALGNNLSVGLSFATYNVAFIILTSFSPALLIEAGYSATAAAALASVPMWIFLLSVPLGGILATIALRHHQAIVVVGLMGSALAMVIAGFVPEKELSYVAAGLLGGLPTGPILARAGRTGRGERPDDLTYSALFLIFFATLIAVPPLAGALVDWSGETGSVLWLFGVLLVSAVVFFRFANPPE